MLKRNFRIVVFGFLSMLLLAMASLSGAMQEETTAVETAANHPVVITLPTTATTSTTTTTTVLPSPPPTTAPAVRPKKRAATPRAPSTKPAQGSTAAPAGLQSCGGDLPPCWVKNRESHGNYQAVNRTGCGGRSCGGAWQFDVRTWNNYGGYSRAELAPPAVQDAKAREVWAGGRGCSHWAACG